MTDAEATVRIKFFTLKAVIRIKKKNRLCFVQCTL